MLKDRAKQISRYKIIFFIILVPFIMLAQNNSGGSNSVCAFFEYIDKYIPNSKDSLYKSFIIPGNEVELIRIAYQNAIALNPYEFKAKLKSLTEEWIKTGEKGLHPPVNLKPAYKIKLMKDKLVERYGEDYVNILSTPIIIKVFLKEIQDALYSSQDKNGPHARQTNLIVEIQEILKGKTHFNCGESISISYLDWWYQDNPLSLEVGKSYLFPVEPWYGKNDNFKSLIIKDPTSSIRILEITNDKIKSIFPVKSEHDTSWLEFRQYFSTTYLNN